MAVRAAHLAVEVQVAVALQPNFNALCSFKDFWGSRMKKIFYRKSNFGTILAGVFYGKRYFYETIVIEFDNSFITCRLHR